MKYKVKITKQTTTNITETAWEGPDIYEKEFLCKMDEGEFLACSFILSLTNKQYKKIIKKYKTEFLKVLRQRYE